MKKTILPIKDIRKEQFDVLYEISRILNTASYEESLIEYALDLLMNSINAERALFVKYDKDKKEFTIIGARNVNQQSIDSVDSFSSGILQEVLQKKGPILYHDVQGDPTLSQFKSVLIHNIKSVIGVPIIYNEEVWGIILADSLENRKEFTEENLTFLDFFSNLVSLALDKIIRFEQLQDENRVLLNRIETTSSVPDMIGESSAMKKFARLLYKVSATDATVLLQGESGTGKDIAARAIHQLSIRNNKPFIAQFCGSIPDTLLESELFGYKKGAFTGAEQDKKGLFEVADTGTFFLDEIADISQALQAKLLRVLQNQEIIRLGDTASKKINVRIITATNQDLHRLCKEGKFREDLFYRLNVFPITIPPLRERKGDIPLLVKFFLKKLGENITIHPDTMNKLESYSWPGNVRQLENCVQRGLILCDGVKLLPEHIILEEDDNILNFNGTLRDYEMLLLQKRLIEFDGNRTLTAKSLGVSVRWVQLKLKEIEE